MGAPGGHHPKRSVRREAHVGLSRGLRRASARAWTEWPSARCRTCSPASFPGLRYLQITRQDKVRQAVSLWKAVQTQSWKREAGAADRSAVEPVFSFRAINYLVRLLTAHDASWDAYFLGLGYEPLKITYEELAESTDGVIRRVLAHLGIPEPPELSVHQAPTLSVQADEISEEWVSRVHEHLAALEAPV